jgi:hypothetical protein
MASALDLPVFAWGPLAEGRLTGKYLSGHTRYVRHPPGLDPADQFFSIANRAGEVRQVHIPKAGYGSCVAASPTGPPVLPDPGQCSRSRPLAAGSCRG